MKDYNPHIKILILNWNGIELTNQCLKSIDKLTYNNYSTMVIDNASTDDSIEKIQKNFPLVDILSLDKNYGYSSAYNLAFKHLKSSNLDFILLLNNDTVLEPDLLERLLDGVNLYGPNHLFCPMIKYLDSPNTIWYAGAKINLILGQLVHVGIHENDKKQFSKITKTGYATGCCILLSLNSIKILGGFDDDFNMYAEDVDFCLRGQSVGIYSVFVPKAKIYHKVSASIGGEYSVIKLKHKLQSVKKLMIKHSSVFEMLIGYPLYLIRILFRGIFFTINSKRK